MKVRPPILCCIGLFVAALVTAVSGCGGGDEESTTVATNSLNEKQYAKKANAICNKQRGKMFRLMVGYERESKGGEEPVAVVRQAVQVGAPPTLTAQAKELQELGAPPGDVKTAEAYVSALRKAIKRIEEEEPSDLGGLQRVLVLVNPAAVKLKLNACDY